MQNPLSDMRLSYTQGGIDIQEMAEDPIAQFQIWMQQAMDAGPPDWFECNAMTLTTTGADGTISSRIVLLKNIVAGCLRFFTNYESHKGRQIAETGRVALVFFWPHVERQVRVIGTASKIPRDESIAYFDSRPIDSRLGAIASPQSRQVEGRDDLEERMRQARQQHADPASLVCPDHWGGYDVKPKSMEFWQGRPSRLHDRLVYEYRGDTWQIVRIAP
ncbi:MAG: pyridoxamine 5'-phosphate oxidase [Planctomycetota bacterium]